MMAQVNYNSDTAQVLKNNLLDGRHLLGFDEAIRSVEKLYEVALSVDKRIDSCMRRLSSEISYREQQADKINREIAANPGNPEIAAKKSQIKPVANLRVDLDDLKYYQHYFRTWIDSVNELKNSLVYAKAKAASGSQTIVRKIEEIMSVMEGYFKVRINAK